MIFQDKGEGIVAFIFKELAYEGNKPIIYNPWQGVHEAAYNYGSKLIIVLVVIQAGTPN